MEIKVLGVKLRVECILITALLLWLLGCFLLGGCITPTGKQKLGSILKKMAGVPLQLEQKIKKEL